MPKGKRVPLPILEVRLDEGWMMVMDDGGEAGDTKGRRKATLAIESVKRNIVFEIAQWIWNVPLRRIRHL